MTSPTTITAILLIALIASPVMAENQSVVNWTFGYNEQKVLPNLTIYTQPDLFITEQDLTIYSLLERQNELLNEQNRLIENQTRAIWVGNCYAPHSNFGGSSWGGNEEALANACIEAGYS